MIDNNTKFQILNQKIESLEKTINKIFIVIFILPIIFLSLKLKIVEEIDFSIFTIKQINLLLSFFPSIFALLFLIAIVYRNHKSKLSTELNFVVTNEKEQTEQFKKESWLKYLSSISIIGEIVGSIRAHGFIGCWGVMIVYFPLPIFILGYILGFFVYYLYYNFTILNSDLHLVSLLNIIFSIWATLTNIIYSISTSKNYS